MKLLTSPRWLTRGAAAVGIALTALVPSLAGAYTPGQHPTYVPDPAVPNTAATFVGQFPTDDPSFAADFADCPQTDQFFIHPWLVDGDGNFVIGEDGNRIQDTSQPATTQVAPAICLRITAHGGEIKLGKTVASVDPITMVLGVAYSTDYQVFVSAEGSGEAAPVRIPGGIIGVASLDPLLDALGLGLSVTPQIGEAGIAGDDPLSAALSFLSYIQSYDDTAVEEPTTLRLPLSIKLNNLLLGADCQIDEFDINLTNGTTTPPEGVEPMTGTQGDGNQARYRMGANAFSYNTQVSSRVGAEFNDNAFAVPGANDCDPLGALDPTVDQLDGLLGGSLGAVGLGTDHGLLDPIVNAQAGLPSPAGQNYASFTLDFQLVGYPRALVDGRVDNPGEYAFGTTAVGSTTTQTVRVRSNGVVSYRPSVVGFTGEAASDYAVASDACAGLVLAPGETCEVTVSFTPSAEGARPARLVVRDGLMAGSTTVPDPSYAPGTQSAIVLDGAGAEAAPAAVVAASSEPSGAVSVAAPPAKRCTMLLGIRLCI